MIIGTSETARRQPPHVVGVRWGSPSLGRRLDTSGEPRYPRTGARSHTRYLTLAFHSGFDLENTPILAISRLRPESTILIREGSVSFTGETLTGNAGIDGDIDDSMRLPGSILLRTPWTRPNVFGSPGLAVKSSISSLRKNPADSRYTPEPNRSFSVVVTANPDGTITYTPAADYFGVDSFTWARWWGVAFSLAALVLLTRLLDRAQSFAAARQRLYITTPYFVPDESTRRRAIGRGHEPPGQSPVDTRRDLEILRKEKIPVQVGDEGRGSRLARPAPAPA